jgi:hypothetical protein
MLSAKDMKTDLKCCAFIKPSSSEAGFHIEPIGESQQAFMVVLREDMPSHEALSSNYSQTWLYRIWLYRTTYISFFIPENSVNLSRDNLYEIKG